MGDINLGLKSQNGSHPSPDALAYAYRFTCSQKEETATRVQPRRRSEMGLSELELWHRHHEELLRKAQRARLARLLSAARPKGTSGSQDDPSEAKWRQGDG